MTDDIKDLLGRALSGEPPMGIDRDEVLDAGRKRLRRRRSFAAGGVAAAVVVAAVGAATLTGLIDVDPVEKMPPAASRTATALPPGLDLPLPETSEPPSVATSRPNALTPSRDHANQLTQRLYQSGLLLSISVKPPGRTEGKPGFEPRDGLYRFEADIISVEHSGSLQLTVESEQRGVEANCTDIVAPFADCYSQEHNGVPVVFGLWKNTEGQKRYLAVTVLPTGTRVSAISSNVTYEQEKTAPPATTLGEPALDQAELAKLIVLSNLHAS